MQEEAGVRGHVKRFLGVFENPESRNRTTVFLFLVTEELESWDDVKIGRIRRWFSVEEARRNLTMHKPRQRRYLDYIDSCCLDEGQANGDQQRGDDPTSSNEKS